jgi:hypothetical protein
MTRRCSECQTIPLSRRSSEAQSTVGGQRAVEREPMNDVPTLDEPLEVGDHLGVDERSLEREVADVEGVEGRSLPYLATNRR